MAARTLKKQILALLLSFTAAVGQAENPFGVSPELDQSIKSGLHALYSLKFEEAEKIFETIKPHAEEHPMVAFGEASVHWWRLSVYVLEADEQESAAFLKAVNRCIDLSKKKIEAGDTTGEAHMTLGGAYGLLGRWQATTGEFLSAYFTGKRAIKFLRKSLKINPNMNDAYMGLGIFDYYVATLPAVVRVLAFLGKSDAETGLRELETAATKGTYANTPSKLFLTDLYANQENKPEKAFELLAALKTEFPESPFVHMLQLITLYNHNRMNDFEKEVAAYRKQIEKGIYRKEFETNVGFMSGMSQFKAKNWAGAIREFDQAMAKGTPKNPFYTWSELYKGYALDASGEREKAKAEYKRILTEPRRWGSHASAKKHLSKPFTGDEKDLEKIRL